MIPGRQKYTGEYRGMIKRIFSDRVHDFKGICNIIEGNEIIPSGRNASTQI